MCLPPFPPDRLSQLPAPGLAASLQSCLRSPWNPTPWIPLVPLYYRFMKGKCRQRLRKWLVVISFSIDERSFLVLTSWCFMYSKDCNNFVCIPESANNFWRLRTQRFLTALYQSYDRNSKLKRPVTRWNACTWCINILQRWSWFIIPNICGSSNHLS